MIPRPFSQVLVLHVSILILVLINPLVSSHSPITKEVEEEYLRERSLLVQENLKQLLGASMILTDPREILVNETLMAFKESEFQNAMGIQNGSTFPASKHFFHAKKLIDESKVFKIIQMLPKGANLHFHLSTSVNMEFVARNLTKWPNLYYCIKNDDHLLFRFSDRQLPGCSPTDSWKSMDELRKQFPTEEIMIQWILANMTMFTENPEVYYTDTNSAWELFEKKILTVLGVVIYEKTLRSAFYKLLLDHYKDNVMYVEPRVTLARAYWLNQTLMRQTETFRLFVEVAEQFKRDHPDFFGAKFIYAPHRGNSSERISKLIDTAILLKENFPDHFIGFDLVGQEGKGLPLIELLPELLKAASHDIRFFFHSGETKWFGTPVDENLVDAVLLNTTRFAHGFALFRHPKLYEIAKSKGIAVELCPISNQVSQIQNNNILHYVDDLRVHPGATYLRDGFPVVVASDNPGIFGAAPLSHDWYMTFMALGGRRADLAFLKQLAINSIKYSALDPLKRNELEKQWAVKWNTFLDNVIKEYREVQ